MTHPTSRREAALYLVNLGLNDCQVSRATRIPRATIQDWRHGKVPGISSRLDGAPRGHDRCPVCSNHPLDESAYSYLLGLYLGDGCISESPRCEKLRIVLDERYPGIIAEAEVAIHAVSGCKVGKAHRAGCYEVYGHWMHWSCAFPQHARGRKHERSIVLAAWQRELVERHPKRFLRGLIHSDGWRGVNQARGANGKLYFYSRYEFTNRSEDIRGLFRWACGLLGIECKRTAEWRVAVSKRPSVRLMDSFIGLKR